MSHHIAHREKGQQISVQQWGGVELWKIPEFMCYLG